jgi:hypothetical protein
MADQCEYLEYRPLPDDAEGGEASDGEPRAYCTAAEKFVQPMRADICNRRYELDPETDCEIYRDHEGLPEIPKQEEEAD